MNLFSKPMAHCKISSPHASDRAGLSVNFVIGIPKRGAHPGRNPLGK